MIHLDEFTRRVRFPGDLLLKRFDGLEHLLMTWTTSTFPTHHETARASRYSNSVGKAEVLDLQLDYVCPSSGLAELTFDTIRRLSDP